MSTRLGKLANRSVVRDVPRSGSIIAGIAETVLVDTSVSTTVTRPPAREHADFFNVVITKGVAAVSLDWGADSGPVAEFDGLGEARRFEFDGKNGNVWRAIPNFQQQELAGGGLVFKGAWNADTNTPELTPQVGTLGDWWIVDVAGNTNLGPEAPGPHVELDWIVFSENPDEWVNVPYGNVVTSWGPSGNTRKGAVEPATGDYSVDMVTGAASQADLNSHTNPSSHVPVMDGLTDGVDYVIRNKQWDVSLHPLMGNNPHQVTAVQTGAATQADFDGHVSPATHVPVMPPADGSMYGMRNQAWDIVEEQASLPEAPTDNQDYVRNNAAWVVPKSSLQSDGSNWLGTNTQESLDNSKVAFDEHVDSETHVPVMPPADNDMYAIYNREWRKVPGADFCVMYGTPSMSGAWNTSKKQLSSYSESFGTSEFQGFYDPALGTINPPVNAIYQVVIALTGRQGNDTKEESMRLYVRVVGGSQAGDYIVSVFDVATDKTSDRSFAGTFTRDLYTTETLSLVVDATGSMGTFQFEAVTFELHQLHEIP